MLGINQSTFFSMFLKDAAFVLLTAAFINAKGVSDLSTKFAWKHYPGTSRIYSNYAYSATDNRQKEGYFRYSTVSDIRSYTSRPVYSRRVQTNDDQFGYPSMEQEGWSPWNGTYTRYPSGYVRHQRGPLGSGESAFNYQYLRSPRGGYLFKSLSFPYTAYYRKGKIVNGSEKRKQTKNQIYYGSPNGYNKSIYSRKQTPYMIHKYPIKKRVHQHYKRYHRTKYFAHPMNMLRNRMRNPYYETDESSTAANTKTSGNWYITKNHTGSPEGSPEIYNGTYTSRTNQSDLYECYDERDQTTMQPSLYGETSTRGYYGYRIFVSTQTPIQEKASRHRYYVARRELNKDFEQNFDRITPTSADTPIMGDFMITNNVIYDS